MQLYDVMTKTSVMDIGVFNSFDWNMIKNDITDFETKVYFCNNAKNVNQFKLDWPIILA